MTGGQSQLTSLAKYRRTRRSENTAMYKKKICDAVHERNTDAGNWHNRASRGGRPLLICSERPRTEEVTLHQLRTNRAPFLRHTMHKFGRATSPTCDMCTDNVEKTAEHFLLHCPKGKAERDQAFGQERDPSYLHYHPESMTNCVSLPGCAPPHQ